MSFPTWFYLFGKNYGNKRKTNLFQWICPKCPGEAKTITNNSPKCGCGEYMLATKEVNQDE